MTGRTPVILAGTAVTVAVLALTARPLLPHAAAPQTSHGPVATPAAPASVFPVASSAATNALACPPNRQPLRDTDCGTLHITRRQVTCGTDTSCRVELVGTLTTRATRTVGIPIALTVTLAGNAGGWRAVEVTS
jgi:hypothetical protein